MKPELPPQQREDRILAVKQSAMAEHGPESFAFADLALIPRMDCNTVRCRRLDI